MEHKYVKSIFLGYLFIIFLGAVLLSLPISHIGELDFIDALFTSASATSVFFFFVISTAETFYFCTYSNGWNWIYVIGNNLFFII